MARPRRSRRPQNIDGLASTATDRLFEWLHPDVVRAEYEAVGKDAPDYDTSFTDVIDAGVNDVIETGRDARATALDAAAAARESFITGAKYLGLALLLGGALYAAHLYTENKRSRA